MLFGCERRKGSKYWLRLNRMQGVFGEFGKASRSVGWSYGVMGGSLAVFAPRGARGSFLGDGWCCFFLCSEAIQSSMGFRTIFWGRDFGINVGIAMYFSLYGVSPLLWRQLALAKLRTAGWWWWKTLSVLRIQQVQFSYHGAIERSIRWETFLVFVR